MSLKIKYFIKLIIFCALHIFYIIPIKKKTIYFVSFSGNHVCCNPKYIYEFMQSHGFEYKYILCSKNKDNITDNNVYFVKHGTLKNILYALISEVYINNDQIPDYIPFRKNQMVIETWHGGGIYKKDGYGSEEEYKYSVCNYLAKRKRERLHYFISSGELFTKYGIVDFVLPVDKFVPYGMPRNDLFFKASKVTELRNKVRSFYEISEDKFIVMYAPTFRSVATDAKFDFSLDLNRVTNAVRNRFGKEVLFFMRGHHTFIECGIDMLEQKNDTIFNVTDYPDMQELICAADMLITDYSSTLWDWSLTKKPAFLYVPDMDDYVKERGTYMPIEKWGFPYAKNNAEFVENIQNFNEENFVKNMENHQAELGTFEHGTAAENIVNDIVKWCEK